MPSAQAQNSAAFNALTADMIRYRDALGKTTNEVLARQALNFSIRYRKLLEDEAPEKSELTLENLGPNIRVRGSIRNKLGGFKGRSPRKIGGTRNKRAIAVKRELAARRSSTKWLKKSIPVWKAALNKDIPEGSRDFGKAYTRRKGAVVGTAAGTFTRKVDRLKIKGSAFAIGRVDKSKGRLSEKAMRAVSADINKFLGKRVGREIKKHFKPKY